MTLQIYLLFVPEVHYHQVNNFALSHSYKMEAWSSEKTLETYIESELSTLYTMHDTSWLNQDGKFPYICTVKTHV